MSVPQHSPQILLVEESRVTQLIVKFFFVGLGYELDIATSGWQAQKSLKHKAYDLIIIATKLPDFDGFALATLIQKKAKKQAKPTLIALTHQASMLERERAYESGMVDYFVKPMTEQAAITIANRYLPTMNTDYDLEDHPKFGTG